MAKTTIRQPGIGHYSKATRVIGVERLEDVPKEVGPGFIVSVKNNTILGENTKFTAFTVGTPILLDNGP